MVATLPSSLCALITSDSTRKIVKSLILSAPECPGQLPSFRAHHSTEKAVVYHSMADRCNGTTPQLNFNRFDSSQKYICTTPAYV